MISTNGKIKIVLVALACLLGLFYACATANGPRFITSREISQKLDISDLTPIEAKRLEVVINREVSPCGDAVTLAESLYNPEHCPLSPMAARFVVEYLKEDYNEDEISKAYVARYAAAKGIDIPLDGSPRAGSDKPVVTLVVFTDFQCPYCKMTAKKLLDLLRLYPDKIEVIHKNFPLSSHSGAELAARAAFAAHRQNKFWEMSETLFSAYGSELNRDRVSVMAVGLGLDVDQFDEDMASPAATEAIDADRKLGERLGVNATPTIFINGRMLELGKGRLESRIDEEFLRSSIFNKR